MWKPLLFAALLLTLSNGAQANGILRIVVRKGFSGDVGDAPNPGTPANTGVVTTTTTTPSNAANPAAAANNIALATGGQQPVVPASVCSNAKSPKVAPAAAAAGTRFTASLSGLKNIKPNTTGIAAAVESPARATYTLLLDEPNQRASWTLELCDVPAYVASHLHTGSPAADFPPPLIPLEPYVKPSNPFAPPNLLPQLCPPQDVKGCSYTAQGSFTSNDIAPLAGREPVGDREVPSVRNFAEFLRALKAGKIYVNVHSKLQPAGLIRGNLQMGADGSGGPTMSGASLGNAGMAGTGTTGTSTTGTATTGNVAGPTGTGSDTAAISTGTGTVTGTGTGTGQAGGATGTGVGTGTGTSTGSGSAGGLGPSTGGLGPGLTGSGVGSGTVGGGTGTGIGTGTGSSAGTGADTRAIGGVGSNSGGAGGAGAGVGAGGGAGSGSGAGGAGGGGGGGGSP